MAGRPGGGAPRARVSGQGLTGLTLITRGLDSRLLAALTLVGRPDGVSDSSYLWLLTVTLELAR